MPRPIKNHDAKLRKLTLIVPSELYMALMKRAAANRRSHGQEAVMILEEALGKGERK